MSDLLYKEQWEGKEGEGEVSVTFNIRSLGHFNHTSLFFILYFILSSFPSALLCLSFSFFFIFFLLLVPRVIYAKCLGWLGRLGGVRGVASTSRDQKQDTVLFFMFWV